MKKMILFVAMISIFAFKANAIVIGPDSSWEEIKAVGLIGGFSTIMFQTEGVTVDELCIDGVNLRPFQPYKTTCAKYDTTGNHMKCVEYKTTYLSTAIAHTEKQCVEWDHNPRHEPNCLKYRTVTVNHPTSYNVTVYKMTPKGDMKAVFAKPYAIEACHN